MTSERSLRVNVAHHFIVYSHLYVQSGVCIYAFYPFQSKQLAPFEMLRFCPIEKIKLVEKTQPLRKDNAKKLKNTDSIHDNHFFARCHAKNPFGRHSPNKWLLSIFIKSSLLATKIISTKNDIENSFCAEQRTKKYSFYMKTVISVEHDKYYSIFALDEFSLRLLNLTNVNSSKQKGNQ